MHNFHLVKVLNHHCSIDMRRGARLEKNTFCDFVLNVGCRTGKAQLSCSQEKCGDKLGVSCYALIKGDSLFGNLVGVVDHRCAVHDRGVLE